MSAEGGWIESSTEVAFNAELTGAITSSDHALRSLCMNVTARAVRQIAAGPGNMISGRVVKPSLLNGSGGPPARTRISSAQS